MSRLHARFSLSEQEEVPEYSAHDFGSVTTIHGLRYVFDRKTGYIARFIWSVWMIILLVLCIVLLFNIWSRWNSEPLIVSLTDKAEPIWEIPFPAITICPETKNKQTIFNLTRVYHNLIKNTDNVTKNDVNMMNIARAASQVCDGHLMTQILTGPRFTNTSIYDDLRMVAPTFDETAYYCQFQDEVAQCNNFFTEVWTDEGLCFTFNLLNLTDIISELVDQPKYPLAKRIVPNGYKKRAWSLENGYERKSEMDPRMFPYEVLGAGNRGAFSIVLRMFENDFDYICRGSIIGFKIAIHLPGDLPSILSSNHFIRIPIKQETLITFQPKVLRTADSLKSYPPSDRGCFYSNEGTLKYFKEYTQRNCELECLTDHTLKNCGCVKFSMPRDESTPICGFERIQCVTDSGKSILGEKLRNITNGAGDLCNCLPACTQISYSHEISQANFDFPKFMKVTDATPNEMNPNATYTRLTIQAKDNYFTAVRRHELYNHTDLLALCGGILALFFGASIFSITELIYYCINYIMNWRKSVSIERRILKNDELDIDNN